MHRSTRRRDRSNFSGRVLKRMAQISFGLTWRGTYRVALHVSEWKLM